jgi:RNA polymerase sigma factor (sigma-70 family)
MLTPGKYDLGLLESARGGNADAIAALLAVAQPNIRRYARRSCRADDVDDAVQEVLWLLQRRVGTLRALTSFAGWLVVLVKRECLRMVRRMAGPWVRVEADEEDVRLAQLPQDDLRIDLARAIESLPEHYRQVLLLRDIEGSTIDEIAAALALTGETVKARLHRARLMMREYLIR